MKWREVTAQEPCPICGKSDWCSISSDGRWAVCRRVDTGEGKQKIDQSGSEYYVYALDGTPRSIPDIELPAKEQHERASADTLHEVYSSLLAALTLGDDDLQNLIGRGLNEQAIKARRYRTLPLRGRSRIAKDLVEKFGPDTCAKVPGFYLKDDMGRRYWTLAGQPGLVIPVTDLEGHIVGIKLRPHDPGKGAKYVWLSSSAKNGTGPGAPVHVPACDGPTDEVRITEGELKADVTTHLSGILTLALPGVSSWRPALPVLRALGAKRVRVAFDADWRENPHVARALRRTCEALQDEGFGVWVELWQPEQGKGIDDLLAAGHKPEVHPFEDVADSLKSAAPDPIEKAREQVADAIRRIEDEPGAPFEPEVLGALALLDERDPKGFAEAKASLKGKVNLNDLSRAIRKAKRPLRVVEPGETSSDLAVDTGFFEDERGCYCNRSFGPNGEPKVDVLSNFVLRPKTRLTLEDEELIEADLHVIGDPATYTIYLRRRDLLGWRDLMSALPTSKAKWLGKDRDVQRLRGHLANQDIPTLKGEQIMGWHGDYFLLPDQVWSKGGKVEDPPVIYVRSKLAFERHVHFEACDDWPGLVREILPHLCRVHEPRVLWPVLGWFFACAVAPQVRDVAGHFPLLQVFGTKGGGKTTLLRTVWKLFGVDTDTQSCRQSAFNLIRALSSSNAIPIVLDEYKPSEMSRYHLDNLHYFLRLVYDGAVEGRGRQDLSTVEYRLVCPVAVGGESRFTDPALLERTIMVTINRHWVDDHPECEEALRALHKLPLRQFAGGYVARLAGESVEEVFEGLRRRVLDYAVDTPSRVIDGATTVLLGLELLSALNDEVGANAPMDWTHEQVVRWITEGSAGEGQPKTGLDLFVMGLSNMAHAGEWRRGADFVCDDFTLAFPTDPAIAAYTKWCRQMGKEADNPGREALRQQLKESEGQPDSYVMAAFGQQRRVGSRNLRCTVLDVNMLERTLGIDAEVWKPPQFDPP